MYNKCMFLEIVGGFVSGSTCGDEGPFPCVDLPSATFWTYLWLESQKAMKETSKGLLEEPADHGHQTGFEELFSFIFLLTDEWRLVSA